MEAPENRQARREALEIDDNHQTSVHEAQALRKPFFLGLPGKVAASCSPGIRFACGWRAFSAFSASPTAFAGVEWLFHRQAAITEHKIFNA